MISVESYNYTAGTKIIHFLMGFFGNILIGVFFSNIIEPVAYAFSGRSMSDKMANIFFPTLFIIAIIITEFVLIKYFLKTKRYIATGMLVAIPWILLVIGFFILIIGGL